MRLLSEIKHPNYRISILHNQGKYTLKIEYLGMEQNYKLRESQALNSANSLASKVTESFLSSVQQNFNNMLTTKELLFDKTEQDLELLDGII